MIKQFFIKNHRLLLIWGIIILAIYIGLHFGLDKKIMALGVIAFGIFTQAFSGLLGIIGVIPVIGPFIVKIATLPTIWITNAIAYLVTLLALRKGAKMDVIKSRVLVVAFIAGIVIGFILGKLL